MMSRFAPLGLCLGILAACSTRANVARHACDPSPSSVAAASDRLLAADNARDLEGVLAGYTEDVVWLPPTGGVISGKAAIRPRYETLFSDFEVEMASQIVEARAADNGQLGFVRGTTGGTLTPVGGGAAVPVNDKFLAVVRCESGEWLVSHLAWSPR